MWSPRMSPRVARAVGATGRTLIGVGILVLLFAAYQLWGTGLQHSRAQDRLGDEFSARLAEAATGAGDPSDRDVDTTTTTEGSDPSSPADPSASTTTTVDAALVDALAAPDHGDPVARLRIPSIGVDEVVVHGVNVPDLRLGPGHFPDSPLPGQSGNAAIAGHRTTYGQPFHDLDQVRPGDEIVVQTLQGEFTYEVMGHPGGDEGTERGYFIVPDTGVEVLDDMGDDRLTLTACHPKFSSRQRIVVTAQLVEDPAPTPPRDEGDHSEGDGGRSGGASDDDGTDPPSPEVAGVSEFGEGLDGDPDALAPAVAWGSAFLLSLAGVVVLGRRWRRWPAYVLGAPVLAVLLFSAFVHLDQYLPAY